MRIEDVDVPRSRPDADTIILRTLDRYGFAWDGAVLRQSERTSHYDDALGELRVGGNAYECACSRRDLDSAPMGAGGERVYPGTCHSGIRADRIGRSQRAWRVRVGGARIEFRDRLQGPQQQDLACDVGDFVVRRATALRVSARGRRRRRDGGITDVVRGADLLPSTPRQVFLQRPPGMRRCRICTRSLRLTRRARNCRSRDAAPAARTPGSRALAAWRFPSSGSPKDTMPCLRANFLVWAIAN